MSIKEVFHKVWPNLRSTLTAASEGYSLPLSAIGRTLRGNLRQWAAVIGVFIILSLIICFSIPSEYRSTIQLSAEDFPRETFSNFSFDFNYLQTAQSDAIGTESYPDLVLSKAAVDALSSIKLPISAKDNSPKFKTLREIIQFDSKKPWWSLIKDMALSPFKSKGEKEMEYIEDVQRRIMISAGKTGNIVMIETLLQDNLAAAALCDSIAARLNQELMEISKQKLQNKLTFSQTQYDEKKHEYYHTQDKLAHFKDTHAGQLTHDENMKGILLSREARMNFEAYMKTHEAWVYAKYLYDHPQSRFFTFIPANVAVHPIWPKKLPIITLFMALGCVAALFMVTVEAFTQENQTDEGNVN